MHQRKQVCHFINELLFKLMEEAKYISDSYISMYLFILFQALVTAKNLVLWICSFFNIVSFDWRWIPYSMAGLAAITVISLINRKYNKLRQLLGVVLYFISSLLYIELHLQLPSSSFMLMNGIITSFLLIPLFTDTMKRGSYSFGLLLLFHIYLLINIVYRQTNDIKFYPLWHILVNLLYNFITAAACMLYCINSKFTSLTALQNSNKIMQSWKAMMDNLSMPIYIIQNKEVIYLNKKAKQPSHQEQEECNHALVHFAFNSIDSNIELLSNRYNVSREEVYFNDSPSIMLILYDITNVMKKEEDKFTQRLVATVTHELRSPLSVMLSTYDVLSMNAGKLDKEVIRKGMIAGKMQESLINDILDVAKINSHKLTLTPISTNLRNTVQEIIDMFQFRINQTKVQFTCDINESVPDFIEIDERRFTQILLNLLSNSAKFTKEGSIKIIVQYTENSLHCAVADSGIGIPAEEQHIIFKKFGMAKSNMKLNSSGTGLGLHLCKSLIEAMNGTIQFSSIPNILTKFEFTIPASPTQVTITIDDSQSKDCLVALEFDTMKEVLQIDDDSLQLYALKCYAKNMGVIEHSYTCSLDALNDLKEGKIQFSIAFIDINMPEVSGYDIAKKLREEHPNSILIALSGEDKDAVKNKCKNSGFDDMIEKPICFTKYKKMIEESITTSCTVHKP